MTAFYSLFRKEVLRFWRVAFQTVLAPVLTALLYLLVFSQVLSGRVSVHNVSYASFLLPGLAIMSILQNAFANSSSSLIQSKITGNIIFILLSPITHLQFFWAYVLAAIVRGLAVGATVILVTLPFLITPVHSPIWLLVFTVLGGGIFGVLGLMAGIWAEKFDQLAAFQNFIIMPLTFLSGVFYSVHSLPDFWQTVSHWSPVLYMPA